MSVIVRFTLQNIKEKKLRTFLIIISIMLSSALFFASIAISTTVEKMIMEQMQKYFGSADIMVSAGEKSKTGFISLSLLESYSNRVKYIVGMVTGSGEYKSKGETVQVDIQGIELEDLEKLNPIILEQQSNLYPFKGNKAIIGKGMAEKYNLKPGNPLGINMHGSKRWFIVSAVSQPVGPFAEDGESTYIIIPRETIAGFYNAKGKASVLYIGLEDSSTQDMVLQELSQAYPMYRVNNTISKAMIKSQTQEISAMFLVMVAFVVILSMFIIYTSFKVIMAERLPIIGTFRSIGATKRMTNRVLMIESLLYGIIGGAIGDILGIGILKLMIKQIMPSWMSSIKAQAYFTSGQLLMAFGMGVLLALTSSFLPIRKVSKIPVKDIVLNTMEIKSKKKRWKTILGICFLILGLAGPLVAPKNMAVAIDMICMFLLVPAVVLLVPHITNGFLSIFKKIYSGIFGNEGILAAQNLRDNKNILNNIVLLGISIAVLLMINIMSDSMAKDLVNYYKDYKYDIDVWIWPMDRSVESRLVAVEGVEDTLGIYQKRNTEVIGKDTEIRCIQSTNKNKTLNYMVLNTEGEPEKLLEKLEEGRNIIVSNLFKEEHHITIGDSLKLKTDKGMLPYTVVGFFDSDRYDGSYAFIAERYLKYDMSLKNYNILYVKTNKDPEYVAKKFQEKFKRQNPWVRTMNQMMKENMEGNSKILNIFKGFGIMTLIIGVFGVFNNLIISFIDRKRSLAILRSVGMNKAQTLKMIFIEALTSGLIGGSVGIITGLLLIWGVCKLIESLGGRIDDFIQISWLTLFGSVLAGIVITVVASVGPALKSSKLNIIESIKYE
ncbi:MAG: ABC transporter permease [Clostridia bacterium]